MIEPVENLETQTALRLLNVITFVQDGFQQIERCFFERFGIRNHSSHLNVRNGIKVNPEKPKGNRREKMNDYAIIRISTKPVFDAVSNFKIAFSMHVIAQPSGFEANHHVALGITSETPSGDSWGIGISGSRMTVSTLGEVRALIAEWLQQHLEFAQSFNPQNPLEGTPAASLYPKIHNLFVTTKWNNIIENREQEKISEDAFSQLNQEMYDMYCQVRALEKATQVEGGRS